MNANYTGKMKVLIVEDDQAALVYLEEFRLFCAPAEEKAGTAGRRFRLGSGFNPGFDQPVAP